MSRTAQLWKGAGLLTLGGALLSGVVARGDDGPPLAVQLIDLGRQAQAQGAGVMAQTFYQKALQLDPNNAAAIRGLKDLKASKTRSRRWPSRSPRRPSRRPPRAPAPQPPGSGRRRRPRRPPPRRTRP